MLNVPYDVNSNGTQPGERDVGGHISKLRPKNVLNILLDLAEAATAYQDGTSLRKSESPFAVNCPE
jgi:hypothetical protein